MKLLQMVILFLWIFFLNNDVVAGANTPTPTKAPFWKQCLDEHTKYRADHKVAALKWSEQLKNESAIWANYLGTFDLLSSGSMGENLYLTSGTQLPSCSSIVKTFYDEEKKYNYDNPGLFKDTERFTQLVWKDTKELGVAYAKRKDGKYIVVFRYKPQGNYNTVVAFQRNVLRGPVAKASRMADVKHITTTLAMSVLVIAMAGF